MQVPRSVVRKLGRGLSSLAGVKESFEKAVMPTYARFDLVLERGQGSYVYTADGKEYLDAGGGIAVNSLGHAHPEIVAKISDQASKLIHISNLYYSETQSALAEQLVEQFGGGKVFFSNSGAEANEGLFKLARAHGEAQGRFEVITAINSFHGRTLGGIAATGQDKIKKGFGPMVDGFKHVPFNDLAAMEAAISEKTAGILIEGIQGEGGVTPAAPEYLLGLRALCDKHGILMMMDSVQCGHFRSGKFQSYQRILEDTPQGTSFTPDAVSMAKSLGCGVPIGAFWAREELSDTLLAGMHGTTYGGNPLACAVALEGMRIIKRDRLDQNVLEIGKYIADNISNNIAVRYPQVVQGVQGLGFMLGVKLAGVPAAEMVKHMHDQQLLAVPAGTEIVRLLPALNFSKAEADELLFRLDKAVAVAAATHS